MNTIRTAEAAGRSTRRGLALLLAALALGGCKASFFAAMNAGGGPVESAVYLPEHGLALDIFPPQGGSGKAPVVLFLYGGRWQSGSRDEYAFVGRRLAEAGILTLVADYRLFPQARFPDFVDDAAQAVQWARRNAAGHGGDPERIFLAGHSAGAHIVALLATDPRYLARIDMRPDALAGVIGIAGPYDFLPLTDRDLQDIFGPEPDWPESQPVNFVDGDEPPFLLLHGTGDLLVWLRNSERLHARLEAANIPSELRRYPGVGHIRILSAFRYPALGETAQDLIRFVTAGPSGQGAAAGGQSEP